MKWLFLKNQEGFIYKISENEIRTLVGILGKKYKVYGPVNTHDEAVFSKFRFKELEPRDSIEFHYPITTTPPTKYLLPTRENILEFSRNKLVESKQGEKRIIFGLSTYDLLGISYLDKEFLPPIEDEIYKSNRKNTLLISIDDEDPPDKASYDIHFKKIRGSEYEAIVGSETGKKIISEDKKLFTKKKRRSKKESNITKSPIHHSKISEIVEKSRDDSIWDELAKICFGCGICTYVCPVCYCFETEDKMSIEGMTKCDGCRERRWDSCMLGDFASISSHDFRPELRDRIYNWYHHKFVRTPREHGFVGCVDCNRCIVYCPAKISFHETLKYLIKKYS